MTPSPPLVKSRFIDAVQAQLVRYQLSLSSSPSEIKAGLQNLCSLYEAGLILREPQQIRQLVRGLLWPSSSVLVRRWCYKAIALIGLPDDARQLASLVKQEADPENQTWAMSALVALVRNREVDEVCAELGLPLTQALVMAGHLLRDTKSLAGLPLDFAIDIDQADDLTLMWAALLEGYGRAPPGFFGRGHENLAPLQLLQRHPTATVSEYAIWALWNNARYGISNLGVELADIDRSPPNARRWINRLLTKAPVIPDAHVSLIQDRTRDPEVPAREGLAIGLRQSFNPLLPPVVVGWIGSETDDGVRRWIIDHMAHFSDRNSEYFEYAEEAYRAAVKDTHRQRILAAAQNTPLYAELTRIDLEKNLANAALSLFPAGNRPLLGSISMTDQRGSIHFHGNINAQNLAFGDMVNSAHGAVQNVAGDRETEKYALEQILQFLREVQDVDLDAKEGVAKAVEQVAVNPTRETKATLIQRVKSVATGVTVGANTIVAVGKLVELLQNAM